LRVNERTVAPVVTATRVYVAGEVEAPSSMTTERRYEPAGSGGRLWSVAGVMRMEGEAEETRGGEARALASASEDVGRTRRESGWTARRRERRKKASSRCGGRRAWKAGDRIRQRSARETAVTGRSSVSGRRAKMRSWRCKGRASHGQVPALAVDAEAMGGDGNGTGGGSRILFCSKEETEGNGKRQTPSWDVR
jgi:hypothetical protein